MITPAFGLTATERVLPKLALDFTTASLDPRVTFTRTTSASNPATYVNSSGYITAATNNQARFDYDPVTLACKGLLIEESRTNICLGSQDLNTGWLFTNATVGNNAIVSPDGTQNADSLTDNSTAGSHTARRVFTIATSTQYTMSCYVKAGTHNYVQLLAVDAGTADRYATAIFDVSSGSAQTAATQTAASTGASIASSSQVAAGNGWFRIIFTFTSGSNWAAASTSYRIGFAPAASGNTITTLGAISYSGTGTTFYAWGAQLEAGAFATSYIPTTTTALTRNADVAVMTGTNFSDWFNASEGTIETRTVYPALTPLNLRTMSISDGTGLNYIAFTTATLNGPRLRIKTANVDQVLAQVTSSLNPMSIVGAYQDNNSVCVANGGTPSSVDTTCTMPSGLNQVQFGYDVQNSSYMNTHLQQFNYWPQRITTAEAQAFSKG